MIALLFSLAMGAPAADVALATHIDGTITYAPPSGAKAELVAFSKLRQGDVVTLDAGTKLQLMYFEDGHSETFAGPAKLVIGQSSQPVARADGDALIGEALRELPALLKQAELDKGGHTLVRGGPGPEVMPLDEEEQALIDEAKAKYAVMRKAAEAEDVLPELFLASMYLTYGQSKEASAVLQQASTRCAECETPKKLLTWLEKR